MTSTESVPTPRPVRSRCWTLHTAEGEVDVEITVGDDERLGSVRQALAAALGLPDLPLWHGSTLLDDDAELSAPALAHGTVLGAGRPGPRGEVPSGASALELQVVGGPEAGRRVPLGFGEHVVGRGSGAGIALDDPDVSRRHLLVRVGSGAVTAADLGSTNGTTLDGRPLADQARVWRLGAAAHVGASTLTLTGPAGCPARTEAGRGGRLTLHPTARITSPRGAVEVELPRAPVEPPRRRLAWAAVLLPAVGGVLMAVVLRTPHFLFFALLSPLLGLSSWASERWSGRRSGRRDRTRHAVAVRAAEERLAEVVRAEVQALDAAQPDLAALSAAAARRTDLVWARRAADADALTVRLGTGRGSTSVIRVGPDGSRSPAVHPHLPVTLDLRRSGGVAVVGPRPLAFGVIAGIVAQIAVLHAPGEVDLLLLVSAENAAAWRWARWLPHLAPDAVRISPAAEPEGAEESDAALAELLRRRQPTSAGSSSAAGVGPGGELVVIVDGPLDPRAAAALRGATGSGVITLALADGPQSLPVPADATLTLTGEIGERAVLRQKGVAEVAILTVDRLPSRTATALARDLAPLRPAVSATGLPREIRLLDLPQPGLRWSGHDLTGSWSRDRSRLAAPVGRGATGPVEIDLCRLGPHALVAGTTGAGKSEFLQSLIAGLALAHPPDRCSFLLIDYKGGAAFAEAAQLPHTVGVLTDLDGRTTERALRSLTAELLRREAVLAEHQVADVAALNDDVDMARLVIVVDEFATLAEELPAFIPGLVGIAQRGRSLGVHLILATQRPAGVVSPEIRANCTLRICLRTTDEADSRDVLGLPQAAHLPLDRPGRAYLRAGANPPVLFQVARVAQEIADPTEHRVRVRPWVWPQPLAAPGGRENRADESDLDRLCAAVRRHAARNAALLPRRPWRPPLPERLTATGLASLASTITAPELPPDSSVLRIGLVDRPEIQAWEFLELDLAVGGAWLAVGAGRSGRTTLLRTALAEAAGRLSPRELHVHVLDHGGGSLAAEAAPLPHTGTTVTADDPLRTVRLLARLGEEIALRRAGLAADPAPPILLLVDGVESVLEQLDEYDPGGSTGFLRLVRDGGAAGLTCLITAERAVPGGRLAAAARQRLVLPLADKTDYAVAGVPSASVPASRSPGRALLGEAALECQIALPRALPADPAPPAGTALRIPPLPEHPLVPLPRSGAVGTGPVAAPSMLLPIGPGGDAGSVLEIDLARSGGLLVAGPPGSGRSTALAAFAEHLDHLGIPVARMSLPRSVWATRAAGHGFDPDDDVAFAAWLAGLDGGPGAVVVDDVDVLADSAALKRLTAPGAAHGVILLASGGAAELARQFQGPVAALRRQRTALLLTPAPGDADLLGVRLPRTPIPRRPGSGWLVRGGVVERIQVARRAPVASTRAVAPRGLVGEPA